MQTKKANTKNKIIKKYNAQKNEYIIMCFNKKGLLSKKNGPAYVVIDTKHKKIKKQIYYYNGKIHRKEKPAYIEYHPETGKLITEKYYILGKLHRENGPAVIERYPDGTLKTEKRYFEGKLHHHKLPAVIEYYPNGKPRLVCWYAEGKIHRPLNEGPALILYDENGNIIEQKFFIKGKEITPQNTPEKP